MKNKLKALLPLLFVIALLAVIPSIVSANECDHSWVEVEAKEPTCTEDGMTYHLYCKNCGDIEFMDGYFEEMPVIPATGHEWSEWEVISEGGCDEYGFWWGRTQRNCLLCGEIETEFTDPPHDLVFVEASEPQCDKPGSMIDHYRCNICGMLWSDISLEEFLDEDEVYIYKHSKENMTLLERKSPTCEEIGWVPHYYCEDCGYRQLFGEMTLEIIIVLPATGHNYVDGVCTVCGDIDGTTVTADGLDITVSGLSGVRDFLIAPGHHEVYSGIKQSYILRVTEAKFSGKESYTALVTAPGEYTVLVRYNDGSEQTYHYVTAEAVTPEFSVSGLSVSISNLEGLRTIRTAPGEWNTPGEVKRAAGARNIPARNISGDTYKLQYAEDGVYTVSLEYTNGLVVVEHFELSRTVPYVYQKGNKITLGDLDDLYVVRYAPGIYETMGEIKRAEGSKYIRPSAIDENGEISFEIGYEMYTICVQYNDGSQYYDYCIGKNDHFDLDEVKSLLEKYGLTVDADLFENKEPGALQDGASLTVTLESENASRIPQVTIKVKRQEEWFLLVQKNPQNLVFSTINNTYIEQITLEWILQGLEGDELDAKLEELYLNSDPLWDISRQYNDFDIVPLELSITIGDETEIITVYPVYEVVY